MWTFSLVRQHYSKAARRGEATPELYSGLGNPVQRGHRFQRKADTNPVIADSG
jgi:hypothetical protein